MANRFDQVYNQQPWVSSYVPMPLDFINKQRAYKQASYDNALDEANKVEDEILKVNAIDAHQPFKQKLISNYQSKVDQLADEIVKTGDTSKVRELKRIARDWQNDPYRNELETSYSQWQLDDKDILESKQKGVYTDVYDPRRGFTGIDEQGNISGYRARGVKPLQDYFKHGSELMKGIAASGNNGKDYIINADGTITGRTSGWKAVLEKDVDRVAQQSLEGFIKDPAGQYFIDEYKYKVNPNASAEELINASYKYLKGLGNKQIFSETSSGTDFQGELSEDLKNAGKAVPYYPAPITKVNGFGFNSDNFEVKASGTTIPYTDKEAAALTKGKVGKTLEAAYAKIKAGKGVTKDITISQPNQLPEKEKKYTMDFIKAIDKPLYDRIQKGDRIPLGELAPIYDNIKKSLDILNKDIEVNSGVRGMLVAEQKNENRWLFGTSEKKTIETLGSGLGVNAKYYIKGESKPFTYDELLQEFPSDAVVEVTGKFSGANPYVRVTGDKSFANARQLSINGKEVIVNGPEKMVNPGTGKLASENIEIEVNKNVNEVYDSRLTPRTPQTKNVWGEEYKILYLPNKDDETKGVYKAFRKGVEDIDGNNEPATSAEELEQRIANREHKELLSKKK